MTKTKIRHTHDIAQAHFDCFGQAIKRAAQARTDFYGEFARAS